MLWFWRGGHSRLTDSKGGVAVALLAAPGWQMPRVPRPALSAQPCRLPSGVQGAETRRAARGCQGSDGEAPRSLASPAGGGVGGGGGGGGRARAGRRIGLTALCCTAN